MKNFLSSKLPFPPHTSRGVAIFSVLAVLTVLAMLCAAYAVLTAHELAASRVAMAALQADLLARSASAHVRSILAVDNLRYDSLDEDWAHLFPSTTARVFTVCNSAGETVGQYVVHLRDNASLLNLNVVGDWMSSPLPRTVSSSLRVVPIFPLTLEGLALDPNNSLRRSHARALLNYRYGRDQAPGRAACDDNANAPWCLGDGIDNNFNGLVDEPAEGVDEPDEYCPRRPLGDDRSLTSLHDAARFMNLPPRAATALARLTTTIVRQPPPQTDRGCALNAASGRALFRALRAANNQYPFERSTERLRRLACRILDARDENLALSTIGSTYGVEAICFNEILANEGTVIAPVQAYTTSGVIGDKRVPRAGAPYAPFYRSYFVSRNRDNPSLTMYNKNKSVRKGNYVFERARIGSTEGSVATLILDLDDLNPDPANFPEARRAMARAYAAAGGTWPRDLFKGCFIDFPYDDELRFLNDPTNFPGIQRKHMWVGSARFRIVASGPQPGHFRVETVGWDTLPLGNTRAYEYDPDHYLRPQFRRHLSLFTNAHCHLITWQYFDTSGDWTSTPGLSDAWIFPAELPSVFALRPNTYYAVALYSRSDNFNDGNYGDERWFTEYFREASELDTDGDPHRSSATPLWRRRRWYQDGVPIRSSPRGTIELILTSGPQCTAEPGREYIARLYSVMFQRPEVIELINLSRKPINILNWQLVANSGSIAMPIATIDRARHYRSGRRAAAEETFEIAPQSYAYITTHEALFDLEFGARRSGVWGDSADEAIPLHVITNTTLWGVHYRISKVGARRTETAAESWITVDHAFWRPDELVGEYIEIVKRDKPPFPGTLHNADGIRLMITRNTRNTLFFQGVYLPVPDAANYGHGEVGEYVTTKDEFYICGLPRYGGLVSLTLKDNYGQIAARTLDYSSPLRTQPGSSMERPDPAGIDWLPVRQPSIGGTPLRARNRSLRPHLLRRYDPCNRPFASVGELRRVIPPDPTASSPATHLPALRAAAATFHTDDLRLYAHAAISSTNWLSTLFTIASAQPNRLSARNVHWQPGMWRGHTVRILSGTAAGARFPVKDNSTHSLILSVAPQASPSPAAAAPGDLAIVGPAYLAPHTYTRTDNSPGEWYWPTTPLDPRGRYSCTLMGLNDSIATTEFLEENHNAALDVEFYDFSAQRFVMVVRRGRYDKNDALALGTLAAPFISPTGGVRLRLTPHGIHAPGCSGFAWFNYLHCAPVTPPGRINLNTAPPEVLAQLPGVSPRLARDIASGTDTAGIPRLKPYHDIGAVLAVRGMSPTIFAAISPWVTTQSDVFVADIRAYASVTAPSAPTRSWGASQRISSLFIRSFNPESNSVAVEEIPRE